MGQAGILGRVGGVLIGTGCLADTVLTDAGQAVSHLCVVSTEQRY